MYTVSLLNQSYSVPEQNETGYGPALTALLRALAASFPQLSGGTYSLTAELDWGASYGTKSVWFKSRTANPASTGAVRLAAADGVYWRNQANSSDIGLTKDSLDNLCWNGVIIAVSNPSGTITAA